MDVDELFSVRNLFWLGNYDAALDEAEQFMPSNDRESIDRDVFVYRCYIAQGKASKVLETVAPNAPTDVLAVRLFAQYMMDPSSAEVVKDTLQQWLSQDFTKDNATVQLISGMVFFREGDANEALKALRVPGSLEQGSLRVQIFLSMNCVEQATEELHRMQQVDDDSTLTQLATAWVHLANGGSRYQEAAYIAQEQIDKTISTPLLLNLLAVSNMHMKKFDQAEKFLTEALAKTPNDPDVIANLLSCNANLGRPYAKTSQLLAQLQKVSPSHPILTQLAGLSEAMAKHRN